MLWVRVPPPEPWPALPDDTITERLAALAGWAREGDEIVKTFEFPSFTEAIFFVDRVADEAEAVNHHPDLDIRYRKVRVALSTHDEGGITDKDFGLAAEIELPQRGLMLVAIVGAVLLVLCLAVVVAVAKDTGPRPDDVAVSYEHAWDRLDFDVAVDARRPPSCATASTARTSSPPSAPRTPNAGSCGGWLRTSPSTTPSCAATTRWSRHAWSCATASVVHNSLQLVRRSSRWQWSPVVRDWYAGRGDARRRTAAHRRPEPPLGGRQGDAACSTARPSPSAPAACSAAVCDPVLEVGTGAQRSARRARGAARRRTARRARGRRRGTRATAATTAPALLLAVDLPAVDATAARAGCATGRGRPRSSPRADGRLQPVCARYGADALLAAREPASSAASASLHALLDVVDHDVVDEAEWRAVAAARRASSTSTRPTTPSGSVSTSIPGLA